MTHRTCDGNCSYEPRSERIAEGKGRAVLGFEVGAGRDHAGSFKHAAVEVELQLRTWNHTQCIDHGCADDRIGKLRGMARLLSDLACQYDLALQRPLKNERDIAKGVSTKVWRIAAEAPQLGVGAANSSGD